MGSGLATLVGNHPTAVLESWCCRFAPPIGPSCSQLLKDSAAIAAACCSARCCFLSATL